MDASEFPYRSVRRTLLAWFQKNARDYPWRKTGNWFHLTMAEMMLRRTRADQAARVYAEFTSRFTTAQSAQANREEVLAILAPLGLKWRTKQILETIDYLKDTYKTRKPSANDDLTRIPGVGEYSNAMIRNRLYGERLPALDSNMARLICRISGKKFTQESRRNRFVSDVAHSLVQTKHSRDLNLAVLDYCALVCKPTRPLCGQCKLISKCKYGATSYRP